VTLEEGLKLQNQQTFTINGKKGKRTLWNWIKGFSTEELKTWSDGYGGDGSGDGSGDGPG